jgi:hypothetical protein
MKSAPDLQAADQQPVQVFARQGLDLALPVRRMLRALGQVRQAFEVSRER